MLLISLQFLVKLFVNNIIIVLSYNLNKYIQYKHVWKLFEVGCLHQHTIVALYRLDRNEKLLEIMHYTDRNWISKTVYSIITFFSFHALVTFSKKDLFPWFLYLIFPLKTCSYQATKTFQCWVFQKLTRPF